MQRLIFSSLSIVVVLLGGCAVSTARVAPPIATTTPVTSPSPVHLAIYGDSLGAVLNGPGHALENLAMPYPYRIAEALGDPAPFVFAAPGYHAADVANALMAEHLDGSIGATAIVVELGTNDVIAQRPVNLFASDYAKMLDLAMDGASPDARLVCLGAWNTANTAARYDAAIMEECVRHGGVFVPLHNLFDTAIYHRPESGDPFHPDAAGEQAIADKALIAIGQSR